MCQGKREAALESRKFTQRPCPDACRWKSPNTGQPLGSSARSARMRTAIWAMRYRPFQTAAGSDRRIPERRYGFSPITRMGSTDWVTRYRQHPAPCRRRSPNIERRCGSGPITRSFTTTWQAPWSACPGGCRRRLPNTRRRCGYDPIAPILTTIWGSHYRACPGGCRRRLRKSRYASRSTRSRGCALQFGQCAIGHTRPIAGSHRRIPGGAADSARSCGYPQQPGNRTFEKCPGGCRRRLPSIDAGAHPRRSFLGAHESGKRICAPTLAGCVRRFPVSTALRSSPTPVCRQMADRLKAGRL